MYKSSLVTRDHKTRCFIYMTCIYLYASLYIYVHVHNVRACLRVVLTQTCVLTRYQCSSVFNANHCSVISFLLRRLSHHVHVSCTHVEKCDLGLNVCLMTPCRKLPIQLRKLQKALQNIWKHQSYMSYTAKNFGFQLEE